MPKASKQTASEHETLEGYEGHFEHFDGGWTVAFETYTQDADMAPLFKGLPDDECQCEHMGYVIKGRLTFRSGRWNRGDLRGRRRVLRRTRAHASALRGDRGRRVQPDAQARRDVRGRHQEHGGDHLLICAGGASRFGVESAPWPSRSRDRWLAGVRRSV